MKWNKLIARKTAFRISVSVALVVALAFTAGCVRSDSGKPNGNTSQSGIGSSGGDGNNGTTQPSKPVDSIPSGPVPGEKPQGGTIQGGDTQDGNATAELEKQGLRVERISTFTGRFMEDGSDRPVENVAALLVTNLTERYLDIAEITYDVDGKTASFVVTGLPAKASVWVLERSAMTITKENSLRYSNCTTSYRDSADVKVDELTIKLEGNTLQATNNTDQTLYNVFVYYKNTHTDGNYLGGIAYAVHFDTIEPGKTAEKLAGHYAEGITRIVRIGWQDSESVAGS